MYEIESVYRGKLRTDNHCTHPTRSRSRMPLGCYSDRKTVQTSSVSVWTRRRRIGGPWNVGGLWYEFDFIMINSFLSTKWLSVQHITVDASVGVWVLLCVWGLRRLLSSFPHAEPSVSSTVVHSPASVQSHVHPSLTPSPDGRPFPLTGCPTGGSAPP